MGLPYAHSLKPFTFYISLFTNDREGLFELPAWRVHIVQGCKPVKSQHSKRAYSQPARESWPGRVTHGTVQRTAVGLQNRPLDHIVADQGSHRFPESPSSNPQREALVAMAELLAKILDSTIKIPGTPFYVGLDPLLGLIPGLGDILVNLIGTFIMVLAARLQVPRIVMARMSLNLLINGTIGTIPILGDLFSVWFRSHARNAVLLREAATKPQRSNQGDWLYVAGIIGGTIGLLLLAITAVLWIVVKLWIVMNP